MTDEERRLRNAIAVLKVKRDAEPDPVQRTETQYEICLLSQQIVTLQRQERERAAQKILSS